MATALIGSTAAASDDTLFNLVHYQVSFGYGTAEHNLYLASNARFDEEFAAHGYSGSVRIPLFSSNPRNWTLFNNSPGNEQKDGATTALDVARTLLVLAIGGALIYFGPVQDYKTCRDEKSAGDCNSDFALTALTSPK
jgi:hypothetical protein